MRGLCGSENARGRGRYAAGLLPALNAPLDALSMGLKRRVAIAQAILHAPALLLLDEPTEGMAPDQNTTSRP
jgi:ABC-2 type transport system ATP-binding protein